jgi:hypothetical protein
MMMYMNASLIPIASDTSSHNVFVACVNGFYIHQIRLKSRQPKHIYNFLHTHIFHSRRPKSNVRAVTVRSQYGTMELGSPFWTWIALGSPNRRPT